MKNLVALAAMLVGCGSADTTADGTEAITGAAVLLFDGEGASSSDVTALESILSSMGVSYATADSAQMNAMSATTLGSYKLILWPGGDSIKMGHSLTTATTARVHAAVVVGGASYLGICAGAFMGETSTEYNVFDLAGTWFSFFDEGVHEMTWITLANGTKRDLVYWDGPELAGFGDVVGRYPNGKPAIAEHVEGNGFVVLSGVHPEAPAGWRTGMNDLDGIPSDVAYTKTLIHAALSKTPLPHE